MTFDEHGHVIITPSELQRQAFANPDALINHWLLPGTPAAFPTYELYARFVDYLAAGTGIHPHHFLFRGSTKIGFSISPNRNEKKTWRCFGPLSDLDLAITDPHFFATVDEAVRRFDRSPENLAQCLRWRTGSEFRQYQARIDQKGRHDCYRFFDLPRDLGCLLNLEEVLKNAPIAECCILPFVEFKAFIFRDRWAVHRRYHTDLDELRRGLTARQAPLPEGGDDPLPAQAPK
ncbi:MAG TPA: hypothetical protein VIK18_05885 [Pirellulales bacterium]